VRTLDAVLHHLRAVYLEMPGLRLTSEQVGRLCGIEGTICQMALDVLVDETFLCVTSRGHYARATAGAMSRPRSATAPLTVDTRARAR
jgi:hypothetical protein